MTTENGLPVPAWKEQGEGPVTVFLHGIGGNRNAFDAQLPAFADIRRAVAWDMPGYGKSVLDREMTFPMLADSLARLLDELGTERAEIVGHSMGGMVAQEFVARHSDRVSRLVLAGTSPAFGKPGGEWQKQFLAERLAPLDRGQAPADFAESLVAGMFGAGRDPAKMAGAVACMSELRPESYRAALNCIVTFDRRSSLADIACPTLLIAGDEDRNAPPVVLEQMAAKIDGSRYVCMTGTGHMMPMEAPEEFNALVRDFLLDAG